MVFLDLSQFPIENEGNFRALLRYRVSSGETVLKAHLESESKNVFYLSPKVQNEIITACNHIMLCKLKAMINSAECFTVLADETADIFSTSSYRLVYGTYMKIKFKKTFSSSCSCVMSRKKAWLLQFCPLWRR